MNYFRSWDYKTGEFDNYFFNFSLIFIDVFAWLGELRFKDCFINRILSCKVVHAFEQKINKTCKLIFGRFTRKSATLS